MNRERLSELVAGAASRETIDELLEAVTPDGQPPRFQTLASSIDPGDFIEIGPHTTARVVNVVANRRRNGLIECVEVTVETESGWRALRVMPADQLVVITNWAESRDLIRGSVL